MVYTALGTLFVMTFGVGIAYESWFLSESNPVTSNWFRSSMNEDSAAGDLLEGHPVRVNGTGHLIPVTDFVEYDEVLGPKAVFHDLPEPETAVRERNNERAKHKAILFMGLVSVGKMIL